MIPKTAFADIVDASWAFVYNKLRGIVNNNRKSNSEWFLEGLTAEIPKKEEKHYCNNCRYKHVGWREDPCRECMRGESRWEKEEDGCIKTD